MLERQDASGLGASTGALRVCDGLRRKGGGMTESSTACSRK